MERPPLYQEPVDPEALKLVSADLARLYKFLPLGFEGERLRIAMADETVYEDVKALTNRDLLPIHYPAQQIYEAIDIHYNLERPSPISNASRFSAAFDSSDVVVRFEEAQRLKITPARDVYIAHSEEASEPEVGLVDAVLRQGARSQSRLFWAGGGSVFEELDGRFYKTGEIAEELHEPSIRRLLTIAGFDPRVRHVVHTHLKFEAEISGKMWPFEVEIAVLSDDRGSSALLTFAYKR